jgi:diaminopimelate epimerase
VRVSKAHACGNDFLIIDDAAARGHDYAELARTLCGRTTGVGADGVEFLTRVNDRAGRIRLHNADGSIAEISGNGTRCVAAWMAFERGLAADDTILLETDAGPRQCRIKKRDGARFLITSGMGIPTIERRQVALAEGTAVDGAVVSTGNPHFVILAENADFAVTGRSWEEIGREICSHPDFPSQTNVEFVRILTPGHIEIRIFERGVGPTSSSGTGSSAAGAAVIALGQASDTIRVQAPGGEQLVAWNGGPGELQLTGPAQIIMTGDAFLPEEEAQ